MVDARAGDGADLYVRQWFSGALTRTPLTRRAASPGVRVRKLTRGRGDSHLTLAQLCKGLLKGEGNEQLDYVWELYPSSDGLRKPPRPPKRPGL